MKALHLSLMLLILCCFTGVLQAQDEEVIVDATKVNNKAVPKSVQDSLKKNFPNMTLKQVLKMPLKTYKSNWEVTENNLSDVSSGDFDVYVLNISGKRGGNLEASYDESGRLIEAKELIINSRLPQNVSTYIVKNYKGYLIDSDKIKRTIRPDKTEQQIEVGVHKGSDKKRLFFDNGGNFIKEKK
jgi:hypothetical protein